MTSKEEPPDEGRGAAEVTALLHDVVNGEEGAREQLMSLVYGNLRGIAARRMANERREHSLQPTELVHEAYLKIADGLDQRDWQSRRHFYSSAAEAMRRILVDHARRRNRVKRGGGVEREYVDVVDLAAEGDSDAVIALNGALERLEVAHPVPAEVVKLRFFAGLSVLDTASALGISERSTVRHWRFARAWLYDRIEREWKEGE